jgi:hypothetical protein
MNSIWEIKNSKALILAIQLGFKNGLKYGDRPTHKEFAEIHQRHPDWIVPLGMTELNQDEFLLECASHGKKVLHIRRNKNG